MTLSKWASRLGRSQEIGYVVAIGTPILFTLLVADGRMPAFVFEQVIVLLIVAVALPWGLGASAAAALVAIIADNLLLRDQTGQPTISGIRNAVDIVLFTAMAFVVSSLVAKARDERARAERAAEQERRAREDRDRLIATVSHDLATPLSVLSGTVQFARRAGQNADLPRLLARLETATGRARALVRLLADAQAMDSSGLVLNMKRVDLRDLIGPVVRMLDHVSEQHPVVLEMPDTPVFVDVDTERMQQVLENLVTNAIKYSPDGGAVEVSLAEEGRDAVVRVRDYGMGISAEALPHIFERSYRAPEAGAAAPGLGLGLAIAAQVIARHGGRIDASPAEGRGTVMSFRVPIAPPAAADAVGVEVARPGARA